MKKSHRLRKLELSKQTIRLITDRSLADVVGGDRTTTCKSAASCYENQTTCAPG